MRQRFGGIEWKLAAASVVNHGWSLPQTRGDERGVHLNPAAVPRGSHGVLHIALPGSEQARHRNIRGSGDEWWLLPCRATADRGSIQAAIQRVTAKGRGV